MGEMDKTCKTRAVSLDQTDTDDSVSGACSEGGEGRDEGSFAVRSYVHLSESEKEILFGSILECRELLSCFLHMRRNRVWKGRSWMYEVGSRFIEKTGTTRSHESVRHHLKSRIPQANEASSTGPADTFKAIQHTLSCTSKLHCKACLRLLRLLVQKDHASCGLASCNQCSASLIPVLDLVASHEKLRAIASKCAESESAKQHAQEQGPNYDLHALLSQFNQTKLAVDASAGFVSNGPRLFSHVQLSREKGVVACSNESSTFPSISSFENLRTRSLYALVMTPEAPAKRGRDSDFLGGAPVLLKKTRFDYDAVMSVLVNRMQ